MHFTVIEHALLKADLSVIRDEKTPNGLFRNRIARISEILAVEILKNAELKHFSVQTPLEKTVGFGLRNSYVLVPVLRAGLGLVDGFLKFLPDAGVSHIGVSRDETTHEPNFYYSNIPEKIQESICIILDPMLATGGSATLAADLLKAKGAKRLMLVSVVAAPEGVRKLNEHHPDIAIYTAALDRALNVNKFILPGLGDAGDRIFGT
ncbi:uracil phosphoribosyltransferase [Chloroherpeton thalassium ATCC 35110]|uniref:Uracil phosphoribosyltransferase n=1 Tax=Chloroherpeton thalassium (strain ATCC 35110 / GB-78) TaxID=517418 RepID=B3QX71_CHLT3|nr:uracil phosphoribosyltransferase [Chloroherpeton thalassium]ACF14881.1 uracil phosphoribosyltransferase [Chloroherpeton thalassium ATCC 35110]